MDANGHAVPRRQMGKVDSVSLFLDDVKRHSNPHMPEAAQAELSRRVALGDDRARDRLIRTHLYLVVRIARQHQYHDVEFGDLLGAGNLGLIRAAELYESEKCSVFAGYAVWWIRRMIREFIDNNIHVMRLPEKAKRLVWRILAVRSSFYAQFGCTPSTEEICAATGAAATEVDRLLHQVLYAQSLDKPFGEEGAYGWGDVLADPQAEAVDARLVCESDRNLLGHIIHGLKDKEQTVLRSHYGLDGKKQKSLSDIGRALGISRERARQIRDEALERLRHPSRSPLVEMLRDG